MQIIVVLSSVLQQKDEVTLLVPGICNTSILLLLKRKRQSKVEWNPTMAFAVGVWAGITPVAYGISGLLSIPEHNFEAKFEDDSEYFPDDFQYEYDPHHPLYDPDDFGYDSDDDPYDPDDYFLSHED
ncbi:unnamed protein product [Ilex paraguariensis]|uniref:Uncharacterized protein n=1 Tax=Ilex paraguariensis TaxID=185542 RepID=A0ABC8UYX0_9AQUA